MKTFSLKSLRFAFSWDEKKHSRDSSGRFSSSAHAQAVHEHYTAAITDAHAHITPSAWVALHPPSGKKGAKGEATASGDDGGSTPGSEAPPPPKEKKPKVEHTTEELLKLKTQAVRRKELAIDKVIARLEKARAEVGSVPVPVPVAKTPATIPSSAPKRKSKSKDELTPLQRADQHYRMRNVKVLKNQLKKAHRVLADAPPHLKSHYQGGVDFVQKRLNDALNPQRPAEPGNPSSYMSEKTPDSPYHGIADSIAAEHKDPIRHLEVYHAIRLAAEAGDPYPEKIHSDPKTPFYGYFRPSTNTVHVNSRNTAKLFENKHLEKVRNDKASISVTLHEIGHFAHFNLTTNPNQSPHDRADEWNRLKDSFRLHFNGLKNRLNIGEEVSLYGTQSATEFVAEVYAGTRSGVNYSDEIKDAFRYYTQNKIKI